jgi:hypothetical protein
MSSGSRGSKRIDAGVEIVITIASYVIQKKTC